MYCRTAAALFPLMPTATFPETIPALQASWAKVGNDVGLDAAGILFFKRIFEIAPGALGLFSSLKTFQIGPELYESAALKAHASKVMATVNVAVGMLNDVPKLLPVLEDLGNKHVKYGILPAHYDVVGQALLDTLALGLGDAFTPDLKAAWAEIYGVIAKTMIGSTMKYHGMQAPWGRYATPATAQVEAETKKSQDSAWDWYQTPIPAERC